MTATTVWAVVCCDNVAGVASIKAKADELYHCGHGEDSLCCWTGVRGGRRAQARTTASASPAARHPGGVSAMSPRRVRVTGDLFHGRVLVPGERATRVTGRGTSSAGSL